MVIESTPAPGNRSFGAASVHCLALTPAQVASPLARRLYDLRHAGVSLRLNAGVPRHSGSRMGRAQREVLLTIYADCIDRRDHVWFDRIDSALGDGKP